MDFWASFFRYATAESSRLCDERLIKGVPLSCGITYMLASPIVNPLVIVSTIIAFQGQAPLLNAGLRIGFGYFIAVMIGLIVGSLQSESILRKGLITTDRPSRTGIRIAPLHDHGSEKMEVGFVRKGFGRR